MTQIKIERLDEKQKRELKIPPAPKNEAGWSVWECEPSTFNWHYDCSEKAYVYEGEVKVKTSNGEVEIKSGDFVTFPKGLGCTWMVNKKIRKVYRFE